MIEHKMPYVIMTKFFSQFMKIAVTKLPLSLIKKLADGKLSPAELMDLSSEVAELAGAAFVAVYAEENKEPLKPKVEAKVEVIKE